MSSVIADTHTIIWYLSNHPNLSNAANAILTETIAKGENIFISTISLIEITYLVEKGRLPNQALVSLKDALQDTKTAIKPISIGFEIATAIGQINRNTVPDKLIGI